MSKSREFGKRNRDLIDWLIECSQVFRVSPLGISLTCQKLGMFANYEISSSVSPMGTWGPRHICKSGYTAIEAYMMKRQVSWSKVQCPMFLAIVPLIRPGPLFFQVSLPGTWDACKTMAWEPPIPTISIAKLFHVCYQLSKFSFNVFYQYVSCSFLLIWHLRMLPV